MKKILFLILLYPSLANGQFKEFDLVNEMKVSQSKPQIVYLTATWCKPCMDKLPAVIDSFANQNDKELVLLFDRHGMSEKIANNLKNLYDSSLIKLFPERYYPKPKSGIKISPSRKVINALIADFNTAFNTNHSIDTFWFGNAVIKTGNNLFVTNKSGKEELIKEIRQKSENHK